MRLMGLGPRAPKLGDAYNCIRCDAWYMVSFVLMDEQGPVTFKHTEIGDPRVW